MLSTENGPKKSSSWSDREGGNPAIQKITMATFDPELDPFLRFVPGMVLFDSFAVFRLIFPQQLSAPKDRNTV